MVVFLAAWVAQVDGYGLRHGRLFLFGPLGRAGQMLFLCVFSFSVLRQGQLLFSV